MSKKFLKISPHQIAFFSLDENMSAGEVLGGHAPADVEKLYAVAKRLETILAYDRLAKLAQKMGLRAVINADIEVMP